MSNDQPITIALVSARLRTLEQDIEELVERVRKECGVRIHLRIEDVTLPQKNNEVIKMRMVRASAEVNP